MKKLLGLLLGVIGALLLFSGCGSCEHNCDMYAVIAKEETCGVDGIKQWKCEDCDEVIYEENIPATGNHIWKAAEAVAPTCTSQGWEEGLRCEICGERRATSIEKIPHTIKVIKGQEASCEKSGITDAEYCTVCEQMLVEQTYVEPLGHTCDVYSNNCSRCDKQDVYLEITTNNDFTSYDKARNAIIYVDYCIEADSNGYYLEIPAECTYVRIVGDASKTYKLFFILYTRTEPFRLDLVNANLSINQYTMFKCESKVDIHIGFYGTSASLVSGKAADGAKGSISSGNMNGRDGAKGERGIDIGGDLTITIGSNNCKVKGGDGGNGGNGCDGLANDGFNGGNGGNGGAGIVASSITIIAEDGYSTSNLIIVGGKGGAGGAGGNGGFLYDDGRDGNSGSSAVATSVKVIYQ